MSMFRPVAWLAAAILYTTATLASPTSWAGEFVVQPLTVPEMKAVFGQVESRIVVPARVRIGGSVQDLRVSQGDEVKEGDVIAVIVVSHALLEALDALGHVAHQFRNLAAAEHQKHDHQNDQPVPNRKRTHCMSLLNCFPQN